MKTAGALGVLVLSLCLCGIAVHAEDNLDKGATAAAETWLGHVDAGDYAGSWREASAYLQGAILEQAWVESLHGVRTPLGKLLSRQFKQAHHTKSVPGAPDGDYVGHAVRHTLRAQASCGRDGDVYAGEAWHVESRRILHQVIRLNFYIGQLPFPVRGLDTSAEATSTNHSESPKRGRDEIG